MVNEPSFKLDAKNGGFNWGFCDNSKEANLSRKFYAIVETSSLTNAGTKYVKFYIKNNKVLKLEFSYSEIKEKEKELL